MNMKRLAVIVLALVFSLSSIGAVFAGERGDGRGHHGKGGHHGKAGHHWKGGHGPLGMLKRLDLTPDQKQKVAEVVKKYRAEIDQNATQMKEARKAFMAAASAENFNENAVKAAADDVAQKMADGMVIRAKIMNESVQFLTPEQKEKLEEMKSRRAERMSNREPHGLGNIERWLEKDTTKRQ